MDILHDGENKSKMKEIQSIKVVLHYFLNCVTTYACLHAGAGIVSMILLFIFYSL